MVLGKRKAIGDPQSQFSQTISFKKKRSTASRKMRAPGTGVLRVNRKINWQQAHKSISIPMAINPFPPVFKTTMTYPIRAFNYAPGTVTGIFKLRLNSLFDVDVDSAIGDLQPLYLDQLLSSTGPYQVYRVNSWRCKITVENTINAYSATVNGCEMIVGQGYFATTDIDAAGEVRNMPNTQVRMLGWYGIPSCRGVAYLNGSTREFVTGDIKDDTLAADSGSNPSQTIYGFVALSNLNVAGNSVTANICVQLEQDVEFFKQDAVAS